MCSKCWDDEFNEMVRRVTEEVYARPESQALIEENRRTRPPPPPPNGRELCRRAGKHISYFWCGREMCPRCGIADIHWQKNKRAPDGLPWGPTARPEHWHRLPSVNK